MNLEEVEKMWSKDCAIDEQRVATEAANIPKLHAKYYEILIREVFVLEKKEQDLNVLKRNKQLYYSDVLTDNELKNLKWVRVDVKVLKTELGDCINADKDMIDAKIRWSLQNEKVTFLKSIITAINNRGYLLSTIVNWKKFEAGG